MPSPFDQYKQDDALGALPVADDGTAATVAYLAGDHWQDGNAWVGPPDLDVAGRATILETKIQPVFVSKNIIGEIVAAHRNAVIGHEPDWSQTTRQPLREDQKPDAQTQALIDAATEMLTEWQDAKRVMAALQKA